MPFAMRSSTTGLAALLLLLTHSHACAQHFAVDTTWWYTDGEVKAIAEDTANARVVVGGHFTRMLPPHPSAHGAVVGTLNDVLRTGDARPNDRVRCAVPDGAGGWYIGGAFTAVDGAFRYRLAHLLADGSLGTWAPVVNGEVNALAMKGDTMYVGGSFSQVNGQTRVNLAAVRLSTGANVAWGGTADAQVRVLAVDGDDLFVGGDFTHASSQPRGRLAVYNTTTHALSTVWDPDLNGPVHALAFATYGVVVGGDFTQVGTTARNNLASLERADGAVKTFNPGPNNTVRCIQVTGSNIYIGGDFTQVGANPRTYLALVHSGGGTSSDWINNMNAPVYSLHLVTAGALYVGGQFSRAGGAYRHRAAAFRLLGNGTAPWLLPWAPAGNGTVRCIEQQGNDLYIGGGFDTLGVTRPHIALLDAAIGAPQAWNEGTSTWVNTVAIGTTRTYVGGAFDSLCTSGALRQKIFAFNSATGALSTWSTELDDQVTSLAVHGGKLYACGLFTEAAGQPRLHFAAFDNPSANLTSLNPDANGALSLLLHGDTLFLGGSLDFTGDPPRPLLNALILPAGTPHPFDPQVNNTHLSNHVLHMAARDGRIYFTGQFGWVGGIDRDNAAAVRTMDGQLLPWWPDAPAQRAPIAFTGRTITMVVSGQAGTQWELRAFDPDDGARVSDHLVLDGPADELRTLANGHLLVGGSFTQIGGRPVRHLARVHVTPTLRVRAFLQGPFDMGTLLMDNNLSQIQAIPLQEPYTALGYVHTGGGGGEVATTAIYGGITGSGIVDWVVVELRDPVDPSMIVASRSALLRRDGLVVDHTQGPLLPFGPDPDGTYYIAIRHRNHLGAMTAAPMDIGGNALADFAASGADTYGTDAVLSDPYFSLLRAGDTNFDGELKYVGADNDRDPILLRVGGTTPNGTVIGYFNEDVTLNGISQYVGSFNDRDLILQNVGGLVPTATRTQQLP